MPQFEIPFRGYYRIHKSQVNSMNILTPVIKSWDFRTIGRWFLLPMAIVVVLFLPPLVLSFILSFVLIVAIKSLHPYSYALLVCTLPGCPIGIRPRGPPIS